MDHRTGDACNTSGGAQADVSNASASPGPDARLGGDPYIWCVTGVASDDVLNLREGAGVNHAIASAIPHDSCDVYANEFPEEAQVGASTWFRVTWVPHSYSFEGWVNSRFLQKNEGDRCALGDNDYCGR